MQQQSVTEKKLKISMPLWYDWARASCVPVCGAKMETYDLETTTPDKKRRPEMAQHKRRWECGLLWIDPWVGRLEVSARERERDGRGKCRR